MQEMRVQSLGQEDPLRWAWQSTPVFLPGQDNPMDRGAWWASPQGHKELDMTGAAKCAHTHTPSIYIKIIIITTTLISKDYPSLLFTLFPILSTPTPNTHQSY